MVGPLAAKTKLDENGKIARHKNFLTQKPEPILPPDCRAAPQFKSSNVEYISGSLVRRREAPAIALPDRQCLPTTRACYHLRRARTRKIHNLRRPRRQRQE